MNGCGIGPDAAQPAPPALVLEQWGVGPPVLFLHGLGASARYWHPVRALGGEYRGVAPDLLGFGRSPKPADGRYDVDAHLASLIPLIELGSVVVAHSTGAILAAALAARRPDLVRAALLIGLPAFPDEATAIDELSRLGLLARLTVRGGAAGRAVCQIMCWLRPIAAAAAPLLVRDLPPEIVRDGVRHTWASYSRTTRSVLVAHRTVPDLAAATAPVVLLHGDRDRTAPIDYVTAAARAAPGVRLLVVEGDHHLAVRRPAVVRRDLQALLDEPASTTRP